MKRIVIAMSIMATCLTALILCSCTVPQVTTNPDGTASTNHIVDPRVTTALITAGAVNAATAPVNPFTLPIELGLGGLAALFAWFAKRKNDKSAANQLLLKTVIQAIDSLDDQKVKDAIQAHAVKVGTEGELNTAVRQVGSGLI